MSKLSVFLSDQLTNLIFRSGTCFCRHSWGSKRVSMYLTHPWKNKPTLYWQTARDPWTRSTERGAAKPKTRWQRVHVGLCSETWSGMLFCISVLTAEFISGGQEAFKIFKCISCRGFSCVMQHCSERVTLFGLNDVVCVSLTALRHAFQFRLKAGVSRPRECARLCLPFLH